MKLKNPQIEDIIIPEEKIAEYKSKVNALKASVWSHSRYEIIKNYYGGKCLSCGEVPTKKIIYDIGDDDTGPATLVERFCEKCYQRWETENKDKDKVKLLDTGQRNEAIAERIGDY